MENMTYRAIMSSEDYNLWLKYCEKGKRLDAILNDASKAGNYQRDATRGIKKLGRAKRALLKKYNLI